MNEGAAAIPLGRYAEGVGIRTYGVDAVVLTAIIIVGTCLNEGRRVGMGILYVVVDGLVISVHLPV